MQNRTQCGCSSLFTLGRGIGVRSKSLVPVITPAPKVKLRGARDRQGVARSRALPGVAKREQLEKRREFRVGGDLQDLLTAHLLNRLCTLGM